uniref:alpha-(1,3)-fucosyltransferase 6 isoform X2 n=1 Tax=Ciona intestinalis TaxID=7719 RepID=UPI000EF47780|nr:alpha-(1,3)-fucosyltransferase 6 isoform X2 [Ciona intestinalis]|eukprot:XP_026690519.1 alpha-(1,3)-fucosyltransferase 6 isoform X2 [Ciona intestinalis]
MVSYRCQIGHVLRKVKTVIVLSVFGMALVILIGLSQHDGALRHFTASQTLRTIPPYTEEYAIFSAPVVNAEYKHRIFTEGETITTNSEEAGRPRLILIWNTPASVQSPFPMPEKCGLCDITTNRTLATESDAIVIHYRNTNILPDPKTRRSDQLYVWLCRESPWTTKHKYKLDLTKFDNYFNSTMTYKTSSEFSHPYVEILHRETNSKAGYNVPMLVQDVNEVLLRKKYLVAWVVSNCVDTAGARRRFKLAQNLINAGLQLHRFGRCFPGSYSPESRNPQMFEMLSQYKFYLAFENTYHCKEYVTEKFWKNGIYSGAVPIVWGPSKETIRRIAPPNSYIHVEDFQSLDGLVKYINYLDHNDTAYAEYFKWRRGMNHGQTNSDPSLKALEKSQMYGYCSLCNALNSGRLRRSSYIPSLDTLWYENEKSSCYAPADDSW